MWHLVGTAFPLRNECTVFGATCHSGQIDFLGETPLEVSKSSIQALGETGTRSRSSQMPLLPSVELCDFSPHISSALICCGETVTSRSQTSWKTPVQREACLRISRDSLGSSLGDGSRAEQRPAVAMEGPLTEHCHPTDCRGDLFPSKAVNGL